MNKLTNFSVITNLAYVILGIVLFQKGILPGVAISAVCLGFGSAYLHYKETRFSAYFDWIGMYLTFGNLASVAVLGGSLHSLALGMILGLACSIIDIASKGRIRIKNLVAISVVLIAGLLINKPLSALLVVSNVFAIAFVPWEIAGGRYDEPNSGYEIYHGFWHILTAYAIYVTAIIVNGNLDSIL